MFGRLVDLVVTFPFLVLVIAIVAVLGPGLVNMYIAVGVVGWVFYARLMRGRGAGAAPARLRRRGHGAGLRRARASCSATSCRTRSRPILVYWMTDMALAILLGSSLGYLGLGAQPPAAEWGVLIADGKNFFTQALVDHASSPASPSCSAASASASPATASPTCWT